MVHVILFCGWGLNQQHQALMIISFKTHNVLPSYFVKQVDYSGRRRRVRRWHWPPLAEECHGSAPVCLEQLKQWNDYCALLRVTDFCLRFSFDISAQDAQRSCTNNLHYQRLLLKVKHVHSSVALFGFAHIVFAEDAPSTHSERCRRRQSER